MRGVLLLVVLFCAPAAGAGELKLATWNLEWLTARPAGDARLPADVRPKSAEDIARLRRYALALGADVVALQEVDGPGIAAEVFPPDHYALHFTADPVVQRTGFAVRLGLAFRANPDVTALELRPGRLRSGADITLSDFGLRLLAVHLKTGCREDALARSERPQCEDLRHQLPVLQGWIAARRAEGGGFVVMGDFNRWMDGADGFWRGLQAAAALRRATEGRSSPCWGGGGFIDHIIAGGAAAGWMDPGSLTVLVYREQGSGWKERLSDHCPVSVRLHVPDK